MPLEYPSGVVKEHTAVREAVGIFDVSHLGKAIVAGPGAVDFVNARSPTTCAGSAPARRSTRCAATTRPAASSTT